VICQYNAVVEGTTRPRSDQEEKGLNVSSRNRETKLVLFDMDGTLINIGYAHREAVRFAVRTVYGLEVDRDLDPKIHQGNTQPNIIRAIGSLMGLSPQVTEAHLDEAMRLQSQTTIAALDDDLRREVLPGVVPLLEALREADHALGLVTGTVSPTTGVILERTGLQRYFPLRTCGDEGNQRVDLLHLAINRAARTYGLEPGRNGLVVVGDAVRDIEAGKAVGARVVAVATGAHPRDALAQHHPDVVLPNLEDLQVALDAIVSIAEESEG
jgi:phosphoglycolate phosphatase